MVSEESLVVFMNEQSVEMFPDFEEVCEALYDYPSCSDDGLHKLVSLTIEEDNSLYATVQDVVTGKVLDVLTIQEQ